MCAKEIALPASSASKRANSGVFASIKSATLRSNCRRFCYHYSPVSKKATYHREFRPRPIECRTSSLNSSINFLLPRNLKFYTINLPSSPGNLLSDHTSPVIGDTTVIHCLDDEIMD